ncbi:MAG: GAF domain-containing protein [Saprospiraceae bacterium]|nr:GAF domain-containing protein [Saprospiraceae bacterium]
MTNYSRHYRKASQNAREFIAFPSFYKTSAQASFGRQPEFSLGTIQEWDKDVVPSKDHIERNFPFLFSSGHLGFISSPLSMEIKYASSALQIFLHDDWHIEHTEAAQALISSLHTLVETSLEDMGVALETSPQVIHLRHRLSGISKYFQVQLYHDYVKKGSDGNLVGFTMGRFVDISKRELLSALEAMLVTDESNVDMDFVLNEIQRMLRSYLNRHDVEFGSLYTKDQMWRDNVSWMLLRDFDWDVLEDSLLGVNLTYGKVIKEKEPLYVEDMSTLKMRSALDELLLERGYRSLVLLPIFEADGSLLGLIEVASKSSEPIGSDLLTSLLDFSAVFAIGMNSYIIEVDNQIDLVIRQHFTAIHPSMEWQFKESAKAFYWARTAGFPMDSPPPIVFREIHPLYGQADIVDSSTIRNECSSKDLQDTLAFYRQQINHTQHDDKHLRSAKDALQEMVHLLGDIGEGEAAKKEIKVTELIGEKIRPMMGDATRWKELEPRLDVNTGLIYSQSKAFDESVAVVNKVIAEYLERCNLELQQSTPHYFDIFKTDGVSFEIYFGASISRSEVDIDRFTSGIELHQLRQLCEINRMISDKHQDMPIPLRCAQLLVVYNQTIDIRFRMDEKRFDIDGSYHARYEILKKRLDKAVVESTGERLTQAGKVAIAYLDEASKARSLQHCQELHKEGLIHEEIEHLDLAPMKGLSGVGALRVTSIL